MANAAPTTPGFKDAIIDLAENNAQLASNIVGVRQGDVDGNRHTVFIETCNAEHPIVLAFDSNGKAEDECFRIISKWKAILSDC